MEDDDSEISLDDGDSDGDDSNGVATGAGISEAPRCSVRFLLGTKQLALLSTRICRVGRSDARPRGPVRETMDRVVVADAGDARASVVMRLF